MRPITRSNSACNLAFAAILFGASVGLGNAFLEYHGDHGAHHDVAASTFDPINCVFCVDGMATSPVETIIRFDDFRGERPDRVVPPTIASPIRRMSFSRARAPPVSA